MVTNEGWIKISREIRSHWLWKDSQKLKWWLDLLLLANWEDSKVLCGNQLVELKRGEVMQSVRSLAVMWGCSKQKAFSFVNLLKSDNMISVQQIGHQYTIITICNYDSYQYDGRRVTGQHSGQQLGQQAKEKEKKQKNKKNNKEEKTLQKSDFCSSSDFHILEEKAQEEWCSYYHYCTGLGYYWTSRDSKHMKELLDKLTSNTPEGKRTVDELFSRMKIFLKNIEDRWTKERLTVSVVNMKYHELLQQLSLKAKRKRKANLRIED